jgi:hypothetical protein
MLEHLTPLSQRKKIENRSVEMADEQSIHTQLNVAGNANIDHIGDRIEYHWHAQNMPEASQLQAVQLFSETVAMSFVDIMRLLTVRSSPLAFQHNHERYSEFVETTRTHLTELEKYVTRYSTFLPPEVMSNQNLVERQLNWALNRLSRKPLQANLDLMLFVKIQELSEYINSFCQKSGHKRYQADWDLVTGEMSRIIEMVKQPEASINIDDFVKMRFGFQQTLLEKYKTLRSIGSDANFDLSFLYFVIDYYMLKFAKQKT